MTLSLTLSVWSSRFTPDEITKRLKASPDSVAIRGVNRVPARRRPEAHGWHLSTEDATDQPAEDLVAKILGRLTFLRERLHALRDADPELDVRLVVYFGRERTDVSLDLSPNMIADLAALGARVFIDQVDLSTGHH